MDDSTATPQQRARVAAENTVGETYTAEQSARRDVAAAKRDTARAIADARATGCVWDDVCTAMGIRSRNVAARRLPDPETYPGRKRRDHTTALTAVATAYQAEQDARTRLREAINTTAAAVAVARQAGATWATLGANTGGISRGSLVKRLTEWRAPTHGRLGLPVEANTTTMAPQLSGERLAALEPAVRELWEEPAVAGAVRRALEGAVMMTRTHALNDGVGSVDVLHRCHLSGTQALEAAIAAVAGAVRAGSTDVAAVAQTAAQAAAAAGAPPTPDGGDAGV